MLIYDRRRFLEYAGGAVAAALSATSSGGNSRSLTADDTAAAKRDRELMFLPAWRQRELLVKKEVSSVELTEAALRRIEALDSKLHAFITVDRQSSPRWATRPPSCGPRRLSRRRGRGPASGRWSRDEGLRGSRAQAE